MYDSVVVGAGPAGSRIARNLARRGLSVALLERQESLANAVRCTGVVSQECFAHSEVSERVVFRRVSGANFYSPSGVCVPMENPRVDIVVLDQKAMEMEMLGQAQDAGVNAYSGWAGVDAEVHSDGVSVFASRKGSRWRVKGRSLVLASGFRGKIPQRLGLGNNGDFVIGAQVELENRGINGIEVYTGQRFAPGFFGWGVPTYPGQVMVGVLARKNPGSHLRALLQHLVSLGKIDRTSEHITYGAIPLTPAQQTVASRVLVVGDAAGQVKSTTGGGIRYAILCADLAAPILADALDAETLSAQVLGQYHRAWSQKLGQELKQARMARALFERLDDARLEFAFSLLSRRPALVSELSGAFHGHFDWQAAMILRTLALLRPWWGPFGWPQSLVRRLGRRAEI